MKDKPHKYGYKRCLKAEQFLDNSIGCMNSCKYSLYHRSVQFLPCSKTTIFKQKKKFVYWSQNYADAAEGFHFLICPQLAFTIFST